MTARRYQPPSISALVAFEAVARLKGFGRAAAELNTSQPAISRHVRQLEARFGAVLLDRSAGRVALTEPGAAYYAAVVSALESLQRAGERLQTSAAVVTLACTHEVSHLFLLPFYEDLGRRLGPEVQVRVLTAEYETIGATIDAGADITFVYGDEAQPVGGDVPVIREALTVLAAPDFAAKHAAVLQQAPEAWRDLPLLTLTKPNGGWATWEDWFRQQDLPPPPASGPSFHNYVYLLEAAVAGRGLALGWRGFIERYLESGSLKRLTPDWMTRSTLIYARLTVKGLHNKAAARCLEVFAERAQSDGLG